MFFLCPHCQFLVAIDPASGLPPAHCPRCGKALAQPGPHATPAQPAGAPVPEHAFRQDDAVVVPREATTPADAPVTRPADHVAEEPQDTAGIEAPAAPEPSRAPASASPPDAAPPARPTRRKASATHARRAAPASDTTPAPTPVAEEAAAPTALASAADASLHATPASGTVETEAAIAAGDDTATPPAGTPPAPVAAASTLPAAAREDSAVPAIATTQRRAPSFARATRPTTGRPRWRALAAIACLALLLALQVLLADRAALAADARWRPVVTALCNMLRCTLPAWHEPTAFTLLARDVRPGSPGVLHVTASFRNDARWAQDWPLLHLALQDVDGRTVGARTLTPAEYLGRAPTTRNGIATGQAASVAFDIAEPSATVVAFTFDFR